MEDLSTYLRGVKTLPDGLLSQLDQRKLSPATKMELDTRLRELRRTIRVRRQRFELETGQPIYVEPPTLYEESRESD